MTPELMAHIRRLVDEAPPLTGEQRAQLAVLLRPVPTGRLTTTAVRRPTRATAA